MQPETQPPRTGFGYLNEIEKGAAISANSSSQGRENLIVTAPIGGPRGPMRLSTNIRCVTEEATPVFA